VLVLVSVDTNHVGGDVAALGGSSDQHLLGTSLQVKTREKWLRDGQQGADLERALPLAGAVVSTFLAPACRQGEQQGEARGKKWRDGQQGADQKGRLQETCLADGAMKT
jgi:hypothetical protein